MLHENNQASRPLRCSIGLLLALLAIGTLAASGQAQHQPKPAATTAKPAGPAEITAVDIATGLVKARVRATQKTFQFKVDDTAVLQSLKPGQSVTVRKQSGQVFQSNRVIGTIITIVPRLTQEECRRLGLDVKPSEACPSGHVCHNIASHDLCTSD